MRDLFTDGWNSGVHFLLGASVPLVEPYSNLIVAGFLTYQAVRVAFGSTLDDRVPTLAEFCTGYGAVLTGERLYWMVQNQRLL